MIATGPFRSASASMPGLISRIGSGACLGLLLALFLGLFLSGCDESATASHPDRLFTDAQRASCPANPFKPEYPMAPKLSAEARAVNYDMEIYTSRGKFINGFTGSFDPQSQDLSQPRTMLVWNGKDAAGTPVPSGYYFIAVVFTDPASGSKENRTSCVFFLNNADYDKMK